MELRGPIRYALTKINNSTDIHKCRQLWESSAVWWRSCNNTVGEEGQKINAQKGQGEEFYLACIIPSPRPAQLNAQRNSPTTWSSSPLWGVSNQLPRHEGPTLGSRHPDFWGDSHSWQTWRMLGTKRKVGAHNHIAGACPTDVPGSSNCSGPQ